MAEVQQLDELGEPVEVAPSRARGPLIRLLVALLGIGLVLGAILVVGGTWLGAFSQTEQGFCRVTVAPCTELSLRSVEALSGVDLPEGTEVRSGYAQELGNLQEFRAVVVLPESGSVTMSSAYDGSDGIDIVLPAAEGLRDVQYWVRGTRDAGGHDLAVTGTDADGREVIVFDERQVPKSP